MTHPTLEKMLAPYLMPEAQKAREAQVKAILAHGKTAVFTGRGVVKKVREWNPDADGDLTGETPVGTATYVMWDSPYYTVTEE